jgi:hypothetical protein
MKIEWNCPKCQKSSTRYWNMQRHIDRRHGGLGEPVNPHDTMQYYKDMNPQNLSFPLSYSKSTSLPFLNRKGKSNEKFSNFLEDKILVPLRRMVEIKSLLSQLSTIHPTMPSTTFNSGECKNDQSEHPRFEDDVDDYSEIVGFRGHVCEKCSIINIDTIFRHNDGESRQIETKHTCDSKRLSDARVEPDKNKIINDLYEKLPEIMKKKVNSWTENCPYLVAREMSPNIALNNCFEINPTDDSHWAVRAIKDKQTILTDEELSDFLCKVRDSTYAAFKVIAPSSQQQQQESSTRCYLMTITNN